MCSHTCVRPEGTTIVIPQVPFSVLAGRAAVTGLELDSGLGRLPVSPRALHISSSSPALV